MAASAPEAYAITVGISIMIGWIRKATMTSFTSRPVILIPKYSGVLPDINPTMKTVIIMYMTMYIMPMPFPPGIDWMNIPSNPDVIVKGCIAESAVLMDPVVATVVTTV